MVEQLEMMRWYHPELHLFTSMDWSRDQYFEMCVVRMDTLAPSGECITLCYVHFAQYPFTFLLAVL